MTNEKRLETGITVTIHGLTPYDMGKSPLICVGWTDDLPLSWEIKLWFMHLYYDHICANRNMHLAIRDQLFSNPSQ